MRFILLLPILRSTHCNAASKSKWKYRVNKTKSDQQTRSNTRIATASVSPLSLLIVKAQGSKPNHLNDLIDAVVYYQLDIYRFFLQIMSVHANTHACTHTCTHTPHMHARTHARTHVRTHAHARTHARTHTHTHTHNTHTHIYDVNKCLCSQQIGDIS